MDIIFELMAGYFLLKCLLFLVCCHAVVTILLFEGLRKYVRHVYRD